MTKLSARLGIRSAGGRYALTNGMTISCRAGKHHACMSRHCACTCHHPADEQSERQLAQKGVKQA